MRTIDIGDTWTHTHIIRNYFEIELSIDRSRFRCIANWLNIRRQTAPPMLVRDRCSSASIFNSRIPASFIIKCSTAAAAAAVPGCCCAGLCPRSSLLFSPMDGFSSPVPLQFDSESTLSRSSCFQWILNRTADLLSYIVMHIIWSHGPVAVEALR